MVWTTDRLTGCNDILTARVERCALCLLLFVPQLVLFLPRLAGLA
jgi:hypothetical protein